MDGSTNKLTSMKHAIVIAIIINQLVGAEGAFCVQQWGDCTKNPSSCCQGLVCKVQSPWWSQCLPGNGPAPSPSTGCCSLDHKSCTADCGTTQSSCGSCSAFCYQWLPSGAQNTCIARWGDCTRNPSGCCSGLFCKFQNPWYSQCLAPCDAPAPPAPKPVPVPVPVPVAAPVSAPVPVPVPAPVHVPVPAPVLAPVPVVQPVTPPVQPPQAGSDPAAINDAIKKCKADLITMINANNTLTPKFVRLIFHDCVGGKCDGCVNINNVNNKGLEIPASVLDQSIVPKYKPWLSRADIWVMAALTAAEVAQPAGSGRVTFDLQGYGRQDCGSNFLAGPNPSLPSPHFHTNQLLTFFAQKFNFTTQQTVAIMGAHALGGARVAESGFNGQHWTITPLELNNFYYQAMLTTNPNQARPDYLLTFQKNQPNSSFPDQFFWTREVPCAGCGTDFLLNADLALAVNLKGFVDAKSGNVSCALTGSANPNSMPTCPMAKTLNLAAQFSANNAQWLKIFHGALLQMSNVGYRTTSGCGQAVCPLQAM